MSSSSTFDIIDTTIADIHAAYQDGSLTRPTAGSDISRPD